VDNIILAKAYFLLTLRYIACYIYIHTHTHTHTHIYIYIPVALWPSMGHDLLILEVSTSHKTTHRSRWNSSGWVISASQRPLPNKTQHSQRTSLPPAGFELTISARERPQTYDLGRVATGTGCVYIYNIYIYIYVYYIFYVTTTRTCSCWQTNKIILFVLEKKCKILRPEFCIVKERARTIQ